MQSVASHRVSVPAVISKALEQQLQQMRPVGGADDAAPAAGAGGMWRVLLVLLAVEPDTSLPAAACERLPSTSHGNNGLHAACRAATTRCLPTDQHTAAAAGGSSANAAAADAGDAAAAGQLHEALQAAINKLPALRCAAVWCAEVWCRHD
jgi:hypothetical protein